MKKMTSEEILQRLERMTGSKKEDLISKIEMLKCLVESMKEAAGLKSED